MGEVDKFGKYEILEKLGEGSFGAVYRAVDTVSGREVALKILSARWIHPHHIERFRREFALMAGMPHPRIVRVFDFGHQEGKYFFTMELLPGKTLEDTPPKDTTEILNTLCDIAEGLAFIHNRGVLHLDLKPGNIFLTEEGIKIGDFGLARAVGERETIASGTAAYMAPEIIRGYQPDMRADLYSFGVIAYELFTGKNPFMGNTVSETINLQLNLPITESDLAEVPAQLRPLVLSLLEKDPHKRPRSAYTVWQKIANFLGRPDNPQLRAKFLPQPVLVGRDEIMELADQWFHDISGKSMVVFEGKRGIGYSRLLSEFKILAQLSEVQPVIVNPYTPLKSIVMQLLSWEFGDPLRHHLPTILWALPEFVGHPALASLGITKSNMEPTVDEVDAHLVAMLEEISEIRPMVVMFEDGTSTEFVEKLLIRRNLGNILFVAKNIQVSKENIPAQRYELTPLSFPNIVKWVDSVLGAVEGLNELVQYVHRTSEGYPKKVDLTLRELVSQGYLSQGPERWRFSLAAPEKVATEIPEEKISSALEFIAAAEELPYLALVELLGDKSAPLVLSELIAMGRIEEREKHGALVYSLTDPDAVEDILPEDRNEIIQIKQQIANALEVCTRPEFGFIRAKILVEIGEFEPALKILRGLAKTARERYNFPLLLRIYDLSLRCAEKLGDEELTFRLLRRKANVLMTLNQFEKSVGIYRQTLNFLKKYPDIEKEAAVLIDLGAALMKLRKYDEALSHLNEALEYSRQMGDERLELYALVNIAAVIQSQKDYTEAANIYWQARSIANQLQNPVALATIETNLGFILLAQQKYTQALDRFLGGVAASDSNNLMRQKFSALVGLSRVYRRLGNVDLARRTLRELQELAILPFNRVLIKSEEIYIKLYAGEELDIVKEISGIMPDLRSLPPSSYDEAVKEIIPAMVLGGAPFSEILNLPLPPQEETSAKLWEAITSFESGQYAASAESAEDLINQLTFPGVEAEIWCAAVQVLVSSLQPESALNKLKTLLDRAPQDPFVQGYLWQKLAEIYAEKIPDPEKGQQALNRAKEFFSRLNNSAKLAELEHIADYLRGSRYGGDAGLLLEVAKAFTSTLEWENLVKIILDRAIEVSGASRALLITPTESGEMIPLAGRTENKRDIPLEDIKFSTTAVRRAVETGKPLMIESVPEDEDLSARQSIIELRILMVIAVPLVYRGELMGVLYADAEMRRSVFSERTVRLLETLGEFAAMALYNAKIFGELVAERNALRAQTREFLGEDFIGGKAPSIRALIPKIAAVAAQDVTVLLLGETGTGKDLLARIIHSRSPRAEKPFIVLNCAAVPETLLEAELFGYEKGAFTGATRRQIGKFELANGGTLFLDEIGDMSPSLQAKLLTALETGQFMRLGGNELIKTDVRIIAATNKNLEEEIKKGNFREDLYYRISTVRIKIPPLRERREDIPMLAQYFLEQANKKFNKNVKGFSPDVLNILKNYHWPGNVRQLKNAIEEMVLFAQGEIIDTKYLPDFLKPTFDFESSAANNLFVEPANYEEFKRMKQKLGEEYERWVIKHLLEKYHYNVSWAAREFGIHRTRLHQLITKYGLRKS